MNSVMTDIEPIEYTDFLDNIDGIVIDNRYDRSTKIKGKYLRNDRWKKQFDFNKSFEKNIVNGYTNLVKRYGNGKNFDILCSCLEKLNTDIGNNEKLLKSNYPEWPSSPILRIGYDNLVSAINKSRGLRSLLKEIIPYSLANRNYQTMISKKDKILRVIDIIQQNLREIFGIENINVTLALCEYITINYSTAPLGTFQYLLKIYCNESTLSEYVIISGEDYPYTVTSIYYGDDPDVVFKKLHNGYDPRPNNIESIISDLYRYDNKLNGVNNIFSNANIKIQNEYEWKKKIAVLSCHVHISYESNYLLVKHIQQLQNEIMELKLRPGGDEYNKTKTHFESLQPLLSQNMNPEPNVK